jgi:hypothetical protein
MERKCCRVDRDRNTQRCHGQDAVELIWENIDNSQTGFVDGQSWATN